MSEVKRLNLQIAVFGGGDGLANISWGANKSFAGKAAKILGELGFAEA